MVQFKSRLDYISLREFLAKKSVRTIANNTMAQLRTIDGETHVEIRYHGNLIGAIGENDVFVSNKGWGTSTTRDRINQILKGNGINYSTGQKNYAQLLCGPNREIVRDDFHSAYFKREDSSWTIV